MLFRTNIPAKKSVDVAVSLYGKPQQSAVTLLSLLKHSGQWIDTIYLAIDPKQPPGTDYSLLRSLLRSYKVVYQKCLFHFDYFDLTTNRLRYLLPFAPFRHSVRYQYAWERSDKQYLLVMHNDVLFKDDLVGAYLKNIGDAIGIGQIGMCHNCPAHKANLCDGERYWDYRPDYAEVMRLHSDHGKLRHVPLDRIITPAHHWPLPECRLNEFVAMINLPVARPLTMPFGPAYPFGAWGPMDTATAWFQSVSQQGYRAVHFDFFPDFADHGWTNVARSGHLALLDRSRYEAEEQIAYDLLQTMI
jgi:hypothetical protein